MCVERSTVLPSFPCERIQPFTKIWVFGSSAVSGSSRTITWGSCMAAAMSATFCFIPFERLPRRASDFSSSENVLSDSPIFFSSGASSTDRIFPTNLRNSLTVRPV